MPDHDIDLSEGVDDLDEIDDDYQAALVWCRKHRAWEWHWMPRELLPA